MPSLPPAYRAIILDQQDQLQRLVKSAGVAPVKALYDRMLADVTRRIGATPAATFGHQQLTGLLAQIKLGLARVQGAMAGAVEDSAQTVGVHAARTLLTDAAKLEQHFTGAVISLPLLEVGRLHGLVQGQIPSLMRAHATSMARFGTQLVGRFEGELGAGLALGETPAKLIDRVQSVGEMEWHRAERIVRTELSFSAGRSARAAADEQAEELDGDMWSRWTEHVSDDGTPLDDRVGVDSEAMHGQVAPPGEPFTQPPANRQGDLVGDSLVGREWLSPPNRPNDRAVLAPWRAHWGVPGWRWEDDRRVPVTETAAARTNAAWMRSRGRPVELESDEEEAAASPVGPGFASPTIAPAAEEAESEAEAAAAEVALPEPPPIGFVSPTLPDEIPGSHAGEISTEIPAHGDLTEADRNVPAVDPQAIADHGWYETPGYADDLERAARAYEEVADGLESPVKIGVTPADNLVIHGPDDAARVNAAADMDRPIPVHWQQTHGVPAGHVPRAGEDGKEPGVRIGAGHRIMAGDDAEEAPPPRVVSSGRASAAEISEAERRAAARIAVDDEREWADRIADAKVRAAATPRGTTSTWRPGDETRPRREVVTYAAKGPKTAEEWRLHDIEEARKRREADDRAEARVRAQRAEAEAEGRARAAEAAPIPAAQTRAKQAGLLSRIGGKLAAAGRRVIGR